MMNWLLGASLRHRGVVLTLAATLMVLGALRAQDMPINVFPDLTAPRVTVITESTGMASEEVERLITFPIETVINGTAGLRRVRSASAPGISVVWAEFDWQTDGNIARQRVTERLQSLGDSLPPEAGATLLAPASSVMGEIAFVALTSDKVSPMELRRIADVELRRRLLGVRGVSQVAAIGGEVKQYHVLVKADRLQSYKLTLNELLEALKTGNANAPGGYVVNGGQESVVRVLGRAKNAKDLAAIVVAQRGEVAVRVGDVADVQIGPAPLRGTASYNSTPAVLVTVTKQPDADTVSTTKRLDQALDGLLPVLKARGVTLHRKVFRQQDFIDRAVSNVIGVLGDGALLVMLLLFLFLWSVRPTLISALAIPLSMLTAVLALDLFGLTLDTMTLGGLAIAIGELVDDAIIDVENVTRRLRERAVQPEEQRQSTLATVLAASIEIRSAIVSATAILMLVFLPLLMLDGLEGRLLRPLALAYLAAILASLLVAVTVTPVLCYLLLPKSVEKSGSEEPPMLRLLGRAYGPILDYSLAHPRRVVGAATLVVLLGLSGFSNLGRSFLPEFNEGSLTINMVLAPGTALEQSNALALLAEKALLADKGVLSVGRRTGRAESDEHVLGVETTELEVRINKEDTRTRQQLFADIRERLKIVPAQFTLGQPISHRIEHMISGQRSALAIKIFGDDLGELRTTAKRIEAAIKPIPGLVDLGVEQVVDIPQLVVKVDADAAALYGFSTGAAARSIGTALWGQNPTSVYEEGQATKVVVKYPVEQETDAVKAGQIRISTPSGVAVPIAALAELRRDSGPNYVLRENVSRRLVVTANVKGADLRAVDIAIRRAIDAKVKLPKGVHLVYAGQFARAEDAQTRLMLLGLLAILGIVFIVTTTLQSWRRALIVLVNLPLALAGGVVGVYLAGAVLSVATTIGFITLFGIAARNGILLATRSRDLELEGQPRHSAVDQAARERLAPILMTAVTAALGLLPLALALGQPGSEIQAPMALVILTGLISSTGLNMVVVPALLVRWGGDTTSA